VEAVRGGASQREVAERLGVGRGTVQRVVFVRRTTLGGEVEILGRLYPVDPTRVHRLVRAELDLDDLVIRCFALHRRDPGFQPLLTELPYVLPANRAWVARMS